MKHTLLTTTIIFLLLSTLTAAAAPTLLSTVDLDVTGGTNAFMQQIDDTHLALLDLSGGGCRIRIINPTTGEVHDSAAISCQNTIGLDYQAGTLAVCVVKPGQDNTHIYKIPEDGFMNLAGSYISSAASEGFDGCILDSSSSTKADVFVTNFDDAQLEGIVTVFLNGSTGFITELPIFYPNAFQYAYLNDETNAVFALVDDFIDNSDPYNNSGKVLDSLTLGDTLAAWNYNPTSPEWVTANGYIVIAGNYNPITESSGSVTMTDIIAYGGRDEIIGLINESWYTADFTDAGAPTLTDTGVDVENYDFDGTAGAAYLHTETRIYYINQTNQILTTWEYEGSPTCSYLDGCYMDEPFVYTDSVLNHGWSGWSVNPTNGELACFGNTQYNLYQFTPITPSTGSFTLEFDARLCGDGLSYLNVWLADGSNLALELWFKGDALEGTIQDHNWNVLTTDLGENVSDPGNITCSGFKRFENTYKVVVHPQNVPKSYDLYVNNALVSANNLWTTVGETMSQVSYVYFGGGFASPYCFWGVDNIQITTPPSADVDEATLEIQRNTLGGMEFTLGKPFSFDRDAHCQPAENSQLCFLRVIIGGLLDGLWRLIVNNPLQSLAFILVAILLIIVGYNHRR